MIKQIAQFYYQGFKNMSRQSRTLWMIILVKLFIMFAILKIFFFPNYLNTNFNSDEERSQHVIEQITKTK